MNRRFVLIATVLLAGSAGVNCRRENPYYCPGAPHDNCLDLDAAIDGPRACSTAPHNNCLDLDAMIDSSDLDAAVDGPDLDAAIDGSELVRPIVDPTHNNAHLGPGSPARRAANTGADLTRLAARHIDGDSRTSPPDIGADQLK